MHSLIDVIIRTLLFILPAYIANAAPVLLGGHFVIDMGKTAFDGRRWLGDGKTFLGLISGLSAGLLTSVLLALFLRGTYFDLFAAKVQLYLLVGFLLSSGALAGDLIGSFIKRRLGLQSSKSAELLDQLTFLAGALLFILPLNMTFIYAPFTLLFLVIFTYLIHKSANLFAYLWGIKKVPW